MDREYFENIVKHSPSVAALALKPLDALITKEVQCISNKGSNGKTPLNPSILAAIKGTCNYTITTLLFNLLNLNCRLFYNDSNPLVIRCSCLGDKLIPFCIKHAKLQTLSLNYKDLTWPSYFPLFSVSTIK